MDLYFNLASQFGTVRVTKSSMWSIPNMILDKTGGGGFSMDHEHTTMAFIKQINDNYLHIKMMER